jgi:hypothetical protein
VLHAKTILIGLWIGSTIFGKIIYAKKEENEWGIILV